MRKRSVYISKFERKTKTNIQGKTKTPMYLRPYPAGKPNPEAGIIMNRREQFSYYKSLLEDVKKIAIFYGNMRKGQLKKIFRQIVEKKHNSAAHTNEEEENGQKVVKRANIKDILVMRLEMRLSSVVFRMQWAPHQVAAKQLISHGKILVNGKRLDRSSYTVKIGDVIQLHESMWSNPHVIEVMNTNKFPIPSYLEPKKDNKACLVTNYPNIASVTYPFAINFQAIIESFSK